MIKPGMIIGERYEIIDKVGSGGMADVYKAVCHKLNRNVAIKILNIIFFFTFSLSSCLLYKFARLKKYPINIALHACAGTESNPLTIPKPILKSPMTYNKFSKKANPNETKTE